MTITTINGRQQYDTTISNGRHVLWVLDTWHTSEADAIDYARRMTRREFPEIPASQINITTKLRPDA